MSRRARGNVAATAPGENVATAVPGDDDEDVAMSFGGDDVTRGEGTGEDVAVSAPGGG